MNGPPSVRHDMVTASDLVRQFGTWRERAARAPVYILHRGRPRLVLASMAVMDALCAPHGGNSTDQARRLTALLDGSPEMIVLADRSLSITAASRSARARFGEAAAAGAALESLAPPPLAPLLTAAAVRVVQSSQAETIDLPLAHGPTRPVTLWIEPYPDGVAVFGRLAGDAEALAAARIEQAALNEAMAMAGNCSTARINARGYLDGPHPILSKLAGVAEPALDAVRFVSLFAAQSRVALGDAVEAVMTDATPRRVPAELLVNGDPRPAIISLAAVGRTGAPTGALALVILAS